MLGEWSDPNVPDDRLENGTRMVDRDSCETSFVEPGGSFICEAVDGKDHNDGDDLWFEE